MEQLGTWERTQIRRSIRRLLNRVLQYHDVYYFYPGSFENLLAGFGVGICKQ